MQSNPQYKNRYLYGTNYRADIITAIETGAGNRHKISKGLGCAYESVFRVYKEYELWKQAKAS
jgi:hypothetical protein